ncbi:hypothetical protein H9Q69_012273 [Fusarium xylarioides]|uniref:Uncharacterized protein n=1 Tax=Fusarium xylarioides TaxID=221167 RepID=A0A9P7HQ56_9HYPO|nr:hypothetical protein H9Q72_010696 [Fusarium xylarioides]KAG5788664.1 hypothetical protein H9Q69_012273 [Fusarium xylarioides]
MPTEVRPYLKPQSTMAQQAEPSPMKGYGDSKWHSHYEGSHEQPAPSDRQDVYPTQAYNVPAKPSQVSPPQDEPKVEGVKTWKTEASLIPTNQAQEPGASEAPNPAGPWYGPNTPVVVARAAKFDSKCWTTFSVILSLIFFFFL